MKRLVIALILMLGLAAWWLLPGRVASTPGAPPLLGADQASQAGSVPLESQAEQAFFRGNYEQSIELYRSVLHASPDDGLAWARLAHSMHELERFEEAIELHVRAAEFDENRAVSQFKRAGALARIGRTDEALDALDLAVQHGYRDRSWAEKNPDLVALREQARFERILNRMALPPDGRSELDFWVGEWVVRHPETGARLGFSSFTRVEKGYLFVEHWSDHTGMTGRGMMYFDPVEGEWCLNRVDSQGKIQRLRGTLADGVLHMTGDLIHHSGLHQRLKLTIEPNAEGDVVQVAQVSEADGADWVSLSDSVFSRSDPMWIGRGYR